MVKVSGNCGVVARVALAASSTGVVLVMVKESAPALLDCKNRSKALMLAAALDRLTVTLKLPPEPQSSGVEGVRVMVPAAKAELRLSAAASAIIRVFFILFFSF